MTLVFIKMVLLTHSTKISLLVTYKNILRHLIVMVVMDEPVMMFDHQSLYGNKKHTSFFIQIENPPL